MSLTVDQLMPRVSLRSDTETARVRRAGVSAYQAVKTVPSGTKRSAVSFVRDEVNFSSLAQTAAESDAKKSSPDDARIEALSREKGRAREALLRIREEIKLMRKVWQFQPREMAKQIARLAKELKEVLNDYKKVQKALADLQGSAAGGGMVMPDVGVLGASMAAGASGEGEDASEDEAAAHSDIDKPGDVDPDAVAEAEDLPDTQRQDAVMQYERVRLDQTPEAMELRGDLEFTNFVKGLTSELRDAFRDVKRWAIGFKQNDKDSEKLYDNTDKELKQLEKELGQFEDDLRRAMPPSIWVSQPVQA